MFVPLHVKSDHSSGYGTASIEELVRAVHERGFGAVALTDLENLYGQVRFHHAARFHGVRPITGVELRSGFGPRTCGTNRGRLVLLARDRAGYESLCRIVSARRGRRSWTPDPVRCLDSAPRGIFFLSDDAHTLRALLEAGVREDDVRFLLVRPGGTAAPEGLRAVADTDCVMLEPADRELHRLQVAIRRRCTVAMVADAEPPERSLPTRARLAELFADVPDALEETARVAEACTLDLAEVRALPELELDPRESADRRLERICRARLDEGRRAGRFVGGAYDERLRAEFGVLRQLGFAGQFLIVAEIVERARHESIPVASRGSAASSLIAHLLGITTLDPLERGLLFERFLHPRRRDLPDIDLDVAADRRDELIAWVFERFGQERVAMIAAHQTFQRRAAYREGGKALGMSAALVDRLVQRSAAEGGEPPALDDLGEEERRAVAPCERLIGKHRHVSVHPGGIVIADPRVDRYAPLELAPKGVLVTQYDMHSIRALGLAKIDLLGNRALSAIQGTARWLGEMPATSDGDEETLRALREARTLGCFQVETPPLRSVLRQLPLHGIRDLVAALAIVRPGPASGAAKAAFLRRANGEEAPIPPHPLLSIVLRETHGLLLFEEDMTRAIASLTRWPLSKAEDLRAALADAQDRPDDMAALERRFVAAAARAGIASTESAAVWSVLAEHAAYTFNAAHAWSYAEIAWQSVFLRTHHPVEFACAVLEHYGGDYPLRTIAADFARSGVELRCPHVNSSSLAGSVESGAVRIGLGRIKRVSAKSRELLLARRPFQDLRDLLERVPLPQRELEALVLCGACDGLTPLAAEVYPFLHEDVLARLRAERGFRAFDELPLRRAHGERAELLRALARIQNELRFLELSTVHPLALLREEAARAGCIPTAELAAHAGASVRIAGLVAASRRHTTRRGERMQFVTFEDETGLVEALLFPRVHARLGDPLASPGPFLVRGSVAVDRGDVVLVVSSVKPFHERARPYEGLPS